MKRLVLLVTTLIVLSTAFVSVASAQDVPNVTNLPAYSAKTSNMSLVGYLRFLIFQQTGRWLSYHETVLLLQRLRNQPPSVP